MRDMSSVTDVANVEKRICCDSKAIYSSNVTQSQKKKKRKSRRREEDNARRRSALELYLSDFKGSAQVDTISQVATETI